MTDSRPSPDELKGAKALSDGASTFFERLFGQFRREPTRRTSGPQRDKERLLMQTNERLKSYAREKERDLERFRSAFDALEEAVCLTNTQGQAIYMNAAARDIFGTLEDFAESSVGQLTLSMASQWGELLEGDIPPTSPQRIEYYDRTLALRVAPVAGAQGRRVGTLALMRDVSGEQVSQRLRSHFIRSISHELKTPLAKIKGTADLISAKAGDSSAVEQMVESLIANVDVLDRMVVEMLDLAELGAGTFLVNSEVVQIEALIGSVVRGMLPDAQAAALEIMLMVRDAPRLVVMGDETRLRWALGHLLRNSIQYTEQRGSIIVVAGLDEENPTSLTIDVIDSGVGISSDDLPRIFERFYRGKPVRRDGSVIDPRGLGQGLYIARSVAEAHHGRLEVRSTVGEGSIFTLILPIYTPAG
jgi:two-component system phosphate regulon sensor histidine kinase PhoR